MALIASVLIALLGVSLMIVAYVAAHRSFLPKVARPEFLWAPGIGLLVVSVIVAMMPGITAFSQCENECDVLDGSGTTEHGKAVPEAYKNCVDSSVSHKQREMLKQMEADPTLDFDIKGIIKDEMPNIEAVCADVAQDTCVQVCFAATQAVEEE